MGHGAARAAVLVIPAPRLGACAGVRDVQCPANRPVRAGRSFECDLTLGEHTTVTIVVRDAGGLCEVTPPK